MPKIIAEIGRTDFLSRVRELRTEKNALAEVHELAGNYALAYLARWAAVENFAKQLGPSCQRVCLEADLRQWLQYLQSSQASKPPKAIPSRSFELASNQTSTIPQDSLLQLVLPLQKAPTFYLLISSDGKYRTRRNKIAHSGNAVSEEVYADFKRHADSALDEIDGWLDSAAPASGRPTSA